MTQCPHCHQLNEDPAPAFCRSCGQRLATTAPLQAPPGQAPAPPWQQPQQGSPTPPWQPQPQQPAASVQDQALNAAKQAWKKAGPFASKALDQAAPVAKDAWAKVQLYGPSKVAFGLMAASALFILWPGHRGIWSDFSGISLVVLLALTGYLAVREFTRRDPLAHIWYATPAAAAALFLMALTGLRLDIATLLYILGAGLLAYTILVPWMPQAKAWGMDWRHSLYGYRRTILIGSLISFLALFLTWRPAVNTIGYWSGGYEYSSYYEGQVWNSMHWYNPGVHFAAWKGINFSYAFFCLLGLLACAAWSCFVPRFQVPAWWKNIPLIGGGVALAFLLYQREVYIGPLVFLIGLGLIGWGAYNLCIKGQAEGQFDLRQIPLEKWLGRWI